MKARGTTNTIAYPMTKTPGPMHQLLAALSFENSGYPLKRNKSTPSFCDSSHSPSPGEDAAAVDASTTSTPIVNVNHVLHGTFSPDGCVEDVFFDAQEAHSGHEADEAIPDSKRSQVDSSLLPMILATRGGFETYYDGYPEFYENAENRNLDIPIPAPPPPKELPLRFLRAGKNDLQQGWTRYQQTLEWRKEHRMDTILREAHPHFEFIKKHYPHYHHGRGRKNEPVFYEQPPRTNLKALREGGVNLDKLLRHYAMITEFGWQYLERDDMARSITIIDLKGIKFGDFVGEVVDFVKKASAFTGQHYPERAGSVYVINVPGWFKVIWSVVKPMVDPVTLEKIFILRGAEEIKQKMLEKIPLENIPPEYGGLSVPLGQSPEEILLHDLMYHNNALANNRPCEGVQGGCRFCSWAPARSY